MTDCIIVIDFGSQYTQLIARRIRELNTYCLVQPYQNQQLQTEETVRVIGIILSGGPESVFIDKAPQIPNWVLEYNQQYQTPILGICYGMQILAQQLGGLVQASQIHEFGFAQVRAHNHSRLLDKIQDCSNHQGHGLLNVWMSHGDQVSQLPSGFKKIASSRDCQVAGMANEKKAIYALQFHPEVTQTHQGKAILKRFSNNICGSQGNWKMPLILNQLKQNIKQTIGHEDLILGLSGGVDSAVTALLLHQIIPQQLQCVFIDNGLLRLHESQQVQQTFAEKIGLNLHTIDARDEFMQALQGVDDPEQKRKIIGKTFIEVFQRFTRDHSKATWLAQGTIYSDVIESAGDKSTKLIKSHHNVALPATMRLKVFEPLRNLFKDEVRQLGQHLGLAAEILNRHPFPGPGLGVRILGEINTDKANILRKADAIYIEELQKANWYQQLSQAFCVFLSIKSVGVVGDYRRYQWVIALRAVTTDDFMTAQIAELPFSLLQTVSSRIVNEITEVSRVVYDISSKPPATIEWE